MGLGPNGAGTPKFFVICQFDLTEEERYVPNQFATESEHSLRRALWCSETGNRPKPRDCLRLPHVGVIGSRPFARILQTLHLTLSILCPSQLDFMNRSFDLDFRPRICGVKRGCNNCLALLMDSCDSPRGFQIWCVPATICSTCFQRGAKA